MLSLFRTQVRQDDWYSFELDHILNKLQSFSRRTTTMVDGRWHGLACTSLVVPVMISVDLNQSLIEVLGLSSDKAMRQMKSLLSACQQVTRGSVIWRAINGVERDIAD